jgi:hypothetical protein
MTARSPKGDAAECSHLRRRTKRRVQSGNVDRREAQPAEASSPFRLPCCGPSRHRPGRGRAPGGSRGVLPCRAGHRHRPSRGGCIGLQTLPKAAAHDIRGSVRMCCRKPTSGARNGRRTGDMSPSTASACSRGCRINDRGCGRYTTPQTVARELWRFRSHMCSLSANVRPGPRLGPEGVVARSQLISGVPALRDSLSPKQHSAEPRCESRWAWDTAG